MGSVIVKLKQVYNHNSIFQFLVSHILILFLSLLIMGYGFGTALEIVKSDTENSYITTFQNSVNILDNELDKMQNLALQISRDESVLMLAEYHKKDRGYAIIGIDAINHMIQLMNYQNIKLIGKPYIFFHEIDRFLYESTFYRPDIMEKYLKQWGVSESEWMRTQNKEQRIPYYQQSGGTIEYVFPFSNHIDGGNEGIIVFRLNPDILEHYLSFSEGNGNEPYSLVIYDAEDNLLWSKTETEVAPLIFETAINPNQYYEYKEKGIIWTESIENGWKYLLILPQQQALERLTTLKNFVYVLFLISTFGGVLIAAFSSVKKGRPIDELYKIVSSSGAMVSRDNPLGETVSKILKNNQDLIAEIETEKPTRQKVFIHDLIRGEFSTREQLAWAAEKADIRLEGKTYFVAVFELFNGNDFYEVDLQTLEEVQIITQVMQHYLTDNFTGQVMFYKRNHKSSTIAFEIAAQKEDVIDVIRECCSWLLNEYQVETRWGISHYYDDLMLLWKAAEEAGLSLAHCDSQNPIIVYSTDLENIYDFYLPDIVQEKLKEAIYSGNLTEVNSILKLIEKENLNLKLDRPAFLKLNQRVSDLLAEILRDDENGKKKILWLNELIIRMEPGKYFLRFSRICQYACQQNSERKQQQRGNMINEIMQYLSAHYMDSSIGLAQIGSIYHISEGYLSSVFKEQAGINFADYLEGIRMAKAKELLEDDANIISEVALQVGYNSVQSFRRAFKRSMGISPKEARSK